MNNAANGNQRQPAISIRFPPAQPIASLIRSARRAEELGFDTIWMVDTPLVAGAVFDPYVDLAIVAVNTERVRLGPAVSNFALRHPVATAAAMLGLDRASDGRAILGLGIGGSALVTLGEMTGHRGAFVTHSTRDRRKAMRRGADLARRIFAGETVNLGGRDIKVDPPRDIPIYVAASGPRALELAGEIADGVIIQVGIEPETLQRAISSVHRGAERAGRDPAAIRLISSTFAVVSDDGEDDVNRVRPIASFFYSVTPYNLERIGISTEKRFPDWVPHPDISHAYDWDDAMAAAATYIPDEVVERFCLVGPPDNAARRIRELAALGIDEVFLRWWSTYDLPDGLVETVGRDVIPRLAARTSPGSD
jgi:5,10-methylenetetrahydromethanopterin reductase